MIRAFLLALVTWLLTTADALAQSRCYRPTPPSCIDMLRISRDRWQFDMCRSEVEQFRNDVDEFLRCQRRQGQEVVQELDETIQRFNACARSEYC